MFTEAEATQYYDLPLIDLLLQAQSIHRQHFNPNEVECCAIINIKTGACPENCNYCSQSGHYKTEITKEKLMDVEAVIKAAKLAKEKGATRFCMGAAWRKPPKKDLPKVIEMIRAVKDLGLTTCVTLGMLEETDVKLLEEAGLDFYNHNIDTSREYYSKVVTTRTFDDRLNTLKIVRDSDIKICCGGILGMGEKKEDRIKMLLTLAALNPHPESVPINYLIPIAGTPFENTKPLDHIEFIRTIALARIMLPKSQIRLSAGRSNLSEEMQVLCFLAGANAIWIGEKLLTTSNQANQKDEIMFAKLGIVASTKENLSCDQMN